jgi:hypothetical protein
MSSSSELGDEWIDEEEYCAECGEQLEVAIGDDSLDDESEWPGDC